MNGRFRKGRREEREKAWGGKREQKNFGKSEDMRDLAVRAPVLAVGVPIDGRLNFGSLVAGSVGEARWLCSG